MDTENRKAWKGAGMEGPIARWYNHTRSKDMEDFRREANRVAGQLTNGARVLEVAPGPGFFSIELAKLGNLKPGGFWITGLDVSRTFVELSKENARQAGEGPGRDAPRAASRRPGVDRGPAQRRLAR